MAAKGYALTTTRKTREIVFGSLHEIPSCVIGVCFHSDFINVRPKFGCSPAQLEAGEDVIDGPMRTTAQWEFWMQSGPMGSG